MRQGVRRVDTHAWPSSNRFLNEMVHQKRCQDPTLLFFFSWKAVTFRKRQWNMANGVFIVLLLHLYFQYLKPTWDTPCFFPIPKGLSKVRRHLFWWTRLTGSQKSRGFLPEIKKEINEKKRPKFQWASQMLLANWQNIPIQLRHPPSPTKTLWLGHVSCWDKYRESKWIFNFCANCVADCSAPSDFFILLHLRWLICCLGAAVALLMVQKSHGSQPPKGCIPNAVNNGISTTNLNWWSPDFERTINSTIDNIFAKRVLFWLKRSRWIARSFSEEKLDIRGEDVGVKRW